MNYSGWHDGKIQSEIIRELFNHEATSTIFGIEFTNTLVFNVQLLNMSLMCDAPAP